MKILSKVGIATVSIAVAISCVITYLYFNRTKFHTKTIAVSAQMTKSIAIAQSEKKDVLVVELPNEEEQSEIIEPDSYYIKVNIEAQVVNIYIKDEQGNYTKLYKTMVCSTGTHTPTSGVYTIPTRWQWGALQGNVYGQYVTKITGNILFHSVPYLKMGDPSSLEYWEYDKLGTDASLGCVRLSVEDAKWIYDKCTNGTKVEFFASADPGELGKPISKKISSYPEHLRNWDPTDPNENNPWKKFVE